MTCESYGTPREDNGEREREEEGSEERKEDTERRFELHYKSQTPSSPHTHTVTYVSVTHHNHGDGLRRRRSEQKSALDISQRVSLLYMGLFLRGKRGKKCVCL